MPRRATSLRGWLLAAREGERGSLLQKSRGDPDDYLSGTAAGAAQNWGNAGTIVPENAMPLVRFVKNVLTGESRH